MSENFFCIPSGSFDGKLSVCCRDYTGELVIGDINKSSLNEIRKSRMRRLVVQSNLGGRWSCPASLPRPINTGIFGVPGEPLVPLLDRLTSHMHLRWTPWKRSLVDLARRPPSHVPRSCAPLSNNPIRRLYEAALSPRSAWACSGASPYSILSARSIRPLCGRCSISAYF